MSACAARPAEDDEYRRFVHMKAKRLLSLLLTAALMLSMMTPVLAASAETEFAPRLSDPAGRDE